MLVKVFCVCEHAEQASSRVCWRGGGGGGATGLLNEGGEAWFSNKQQAVEFPQVLTSVVLI